jgi:predicted nucleic acid-binding protein
VQIVIDASAGLYVAASARGFAGLARHELVAPGLFWSETTSSLREAVYRGVMNVGAASRALEAVLAAGIERVTLPESYRRAFEIADKLGWAKTYDAEYVAVAAIRELPLLTRDARLARAASRIVRIVSPGELEA